ncbi:MAG: TetR/AcrR family transcriptional regulator [Polyangiales bacterium]
MAAATRLFAAQGFEATSIQAVADEVGVTKQAVLHHFANKELLRHAVLDAILAHWNDALPRLLLAAAGEGNRQRSRSEDRFDAVFGELHRFFAEDHNRALVVLREALDRPTEMRKLLRGPVRPWLAAITGYIRAGQEAGTHHADLDAEAYVVHILQLVIAAAASAPVWSALVDSRPRYDAELARIARSSLFLPSTKPKSRKK